MSLFLQKYKSFNDHKKEKGGIHPAPFPSGCKVTSEDPALLKLVLHIVLLSSLCFFFLGGGGRESGTASFPLAKRLHFTDLALLFRVSVAYKFTFICVTK